MLLTHILKRCESAESALAYSHPRANYILCFVCFPFQLQSMVKAHIENEIEYMKKPKREIELVCLAPRVPSVCILEVAVTVNGIRYFTELVEEGHETFFSRHSVHRRHSLGAHVQEIRGSVLKIFDPSSWLISRIIPCCIPVGAKNDIAVVGVGPFTDTGRLKVKFVRSDESELHQAKGNEYMGNILCSAPTSNNSQLVQVKISSGDGRFMGRAPSAPEGANLLRFYLPPVIAKARPCLFPINREVVSGMDKSTEDLEISLCGKGLFLSPDALVTYISKASKQEKTFIVSMHEEKVGALSCNEERILAPVPTVRDSFKINIMFSMDAGFSFNKVEQPIYCFDIAHISPRVGPVTGGTVVKAFLRSDNGIVLDDLEEEIDVRVRIAYVVQAAADVCARVDSKATGKGAQENESDQDNPHIQSKGTATDSRTTIKEHIISELVECEGRLLSKAECKEISAARKFLGVVEFLFPACPEKICIGARALSSKAYEGDLIDENICEFIQAGIDISINGGGAYTRDRNHFGFFGPNRTVSVAPRCVLSQGGAELTLVLEKALRSDTSIQSCEREMKVRFIAVEDELESVVDVTVIDEITVKCIAPAMATQGLVRIEVSRNGQQYNSQRVPIFVVYNRPPDLKSVFPAVGMVEESTAISLHGMNFAGNHRLFVQFRILSHKTTVKANLPPSRDIGILLSNFYQACDFNDGFVLENELFGPASSLSIASPSNTQMLPLRSTQRILKEEDIFEMKARYSSLLTPQERKSIIKAARSIQAGWREKLRHRVNANTAKWHTVVAARAQKRADESTAILAELRRVTGIKDRRKGKLGRSRTRGRNMRRTLSSRASSSRTQESLENQAEGEAAEPKDEVKIEMSALRTAVNRLLRKAGEQSIVRCKAPPLAISGTAEIYLSLDGKQFIRAPFLSNASGVNAYRGFLYGRPAGLKSIAPSAGLIQGGNRVAIKGSNFGNSGEVCPCFHARSLRRAICF